ncbi:MAG: ROK family protein [Pedobacter sp.]|uniref:ROK family protein n=1 Tax=Pedobacter sp. TaxID=1411316 RepID=UPI0028093848|nr:ROK family protein [Pedobacter sp.]MDQ8004782.1 ROK family protein [Pedobacter sp.]
MEKPTVLGVDIGGSHITAAIVDLDKGVLVKDSIKRNEVNSRKEKDEILSAWYKVIRNANGGDLNENCRIGIAMPGPFDYKNGISLIKDQDKFNSLFGLNIKDELADRLGIPATNIKFVNDAASFMYGEVNYGAAKGFANALGVTLGTGLGSATSINGVAKDAELWNSKFLTGIAEDYLSTRWFVNKYKDLTGKDVEGVKKLAAMVKVDPFAKQIFNEFGRSLGHFLVDFIKSTRSEIVVLGGNISKSFDLFGPPLIENLRAFNLDTVVKITKLNEHAQLIGAASRWKDVVDEKIAQH